MSAMVEGFAEISSAHQRVRNGR